MPTCVLNNDVYDKIKILHELSSVAWFIRQHAERDAVKRGDNEMQKTLSELCKDLDKHIREIKKQL
ncbi:hypothetical protein HRU45_01250 [Candidatus Dependentiae bacterium]|nr:hypothetical protein [Candidatus Dependentiae bacterium]